MSLDDFPSHATFSLFKAPVSLDSWWADAPRESFSQQCRTAYHDHMRGSAGEKMVSNNSPNVLFDVSRARVKFNP